MNELVGKRAIITGASKGIGRALALGFARAGASVVVNYKTDRAGAESLCAMIRREGGIAHPLQADVGSHDGPSDLVPAAAGLLGGLDILVNNAGRTMFGSPEDVSLEEWSYVMETNVTGVFFASVQAAQQMRAAGGGSIVNITSCAATLMVHDHAVYTTSKSAVEGMTRQLALEFAPEVRVNAIAPGPTLVERNLEYGDDFEVSWGRTIPMGRVAHPYDDLVGPAVFLASDQSRYLTGEVLHVDGGWSLKGSTPDMKALDYDADRRRG